MMQILPLAIAFALAVSAGAEGATPRKRGAAAQERTPPPQAAPERAHLGLAGPVRVDSLRMTLNFVHPYGESGDTPPNLAFTRGESIEERRKALSEAKQRARMLAEAAKAGFVWYVIVLRKEGSPSEERRSPASAQTTEGRPSSADAMVMASIEGRCITVSQYEAIPISSLSEELRQVLGQRGLEAAPAEALPQSPPS